MSKPIYMDYAATTPVDPQVAEVMLRYLTADGHFGNPASRSHEYGWTAAQAVEQARRDVAMLIGATAEEIVWTSGATESNNLALRGAALSYQHKGRHIITSSVEHKAVLDTCKQLEKDGFRVTYLPPNSVGCVEPAAVEAAIQPDTILLSFMLVNNETGAINDIAAIGAIARKHQIVMHTDAAQAAGKIAIDVDTLNVDLLSLSAHKIYGPKGMGALYVRRKPRVRITPQMFGGGHERGLRSGTLPTHQIVGMGQAFKLARTRLNDDFAHMVTLKQAMWSILRTLPEIYVNGDLETAVPNILNVSFAYVDGEALITSVPAVAVSSGSACTSASLESSYVLRALGRSDELAHSSLRFSFGRSTTLADVEKVAHLVVQKVTQLRALSPLWESHMAGLELEQWRHVVG